MGKITVLQSDSPKQYWFRLREVFLYRDLLRMLSYRDIRVRYAQTFLGMAWAVINPSISMILLYFVFGVIVKTDIQGVPPLLFTMAGLCSWNYFARVAGEAGGSLIGAQSLVKKVYFPRLIIPASKAISALVDLLVVFVLLGVMLLWYQIQLHWQALLIIPLTFLAILAGIACGVWASALSIRYRDFNHILPAFLRIGMFLSPIAYRATIVPQEYQWLYYLNPLSGIMEGFRWALFNTTLDPISLVMSVLITLILLVTGVWYFLRMDHYIADIL